MVELRGYQQEQLDFLKAHPFSANWAEAGLGKTRPMLMAAEGRVLVVAPAAVRDTKVWSNEAAKIDKEPPRVVSYHEVGRAGKTPDWEVDTLLLDESQWALNNKTTWFPGLETLAHRATRVHQSTGTPMPNSANEIWGQFHLLFGQTERPFKYKWPWLEQWFVVEKSRFNPDAREVSVGLRGCDHKGAEAEHCDHWQAFHEANIEGRAIRHLRDDVLKDLPPLTGADDPLWTPMSTTQSRAYRSMKKSLLALIPEEGIMLEALTRGEQFSMLMRLASGVSSLTNDPADDKQSGKLVAFADALSFRKRPTLTTAWYKFSAQAMGRVAQAQGKTVAFMGSKTTPKQRAQLVQEFGQGRWDVMVASIGVIKEGVDGLQYASDETILFERSWRFGDNEQTIRRLHRLGQEYPVTARQLVTPDSADSYQWGRIREKEWNVHLALRRAEIAKLI